MNGGQRDSTSSPAPRNALLWRLSLLAAVLLLPFAVYADDAPDRKIDVEVQVRGDEVIVDVRCYVAATPQQAWSVMIDFDHAVQFISNLQRSEVLSRTKDTLLVSQRGTMGFGPFSAILESVAEVRLKPFDSMQTHMISGNMKKYEATTTMVPEGAGTAITYHVESIPDVWIPPIIGRLVVLHETRDRFEQLLDEILRRKAAEIRTP